MARREECDAPEQAAKAAQEQLVEQLLQAL